MQSDSKNQNYKTPQWVKTFGAIVVALALIVVIILLSGHNPAGHMSLGHAETTEVSGQ